MLYSDGLTDAEDEQGEPFGVDRLTDSLNVGTATSVEHTLAQLDQHLAGRRPHDDVSIALIALR